MPPFLLFREERCFIKIYGYIRVSTADQNEDRQLDAMTDLSIPDAQIFTDKLSGKDLADVRQRYFLSPDCTPAVGMRHLRQARHH